MTYHSVLGGTNMKLNLKMEDMDMWSFLWEMPSLMRFVHQIVEMSQAAT